MFSRRRSLCFAMHCFASLYFALLCFAMRCHALLWWAVLCHALLVYALLWPNDLLCYAMLGYALLCLAVPLSGFLWFWGWPVSDSPSPGPARKCRNSHDFCTNLTPNRKFLEKHALFGTLCGGDHGRPQKVKKYNKNITENHNGKCRDDFRKKKSSGNFHQNRWKVNTKIVVHTN